jgi:hypothetical protein
LILRVYVDELEAPGGVRPDVCDRSFGAVMSLKVSFRNIIEVGPEVDWRSNVRQKAFHRALEKFLEF